MEESPNYYNELSVDDSPTNSLSQLINFNFTKNINETNKQSGGDPVEAPTTSMMTFNTKNDKVPNVQPPQVQYEFKAFYPKQQPQKSNIVMPSVITPGINPMVDGNAKYIMPIVNNININGLDPFNTKTELAPIIEYLLPLSNVSEIFNTIKDRQLVSDFIKSILLFNEDGIVIDSLKYNIKKLMNALKVVKMNPYVSHEMYGKISPFKFPENFLLYKSCFPIKYIQNTIRCEKNSTHINLRFYRIPLGEVINRRDNETINHSKALSEMKYYNYIKNEIVYKHESPNFVLMYGYNFYNDKDVIFNEGNKDIIKEKEIIENLSPDLYTQVYNELKYYIYKKYIENHENKGLFFNIHEHELKLQEDIKRFCLENNIEMAQLTQPTLEQLITKYIILMDYELRKKAITLLNSITLKDKYQNDFILAITESPTYNIYDWASKIYSDNIGIKTMINTGYHSYNQWCSVLFQMLTAFHSLIKHNIYIPDFKLGENIYIYNIPNIPTNPKVWKYLVDGVEYFVPNYGDFVMVDSSFKYKGTINTFGKYIGKNMMYEKDYNIDEDHFDSIYGYNRDKMITMLIECFNVSNFKDNIFYSRGGTAPENKTLELINNIYTYLNHNIKDDDVENIFKNAIHMFMTQFLNNRVGTYLQEEESKEQLREITNDTPSGSYIVYLDKSGRYKIGVYIKNNDDDIPKEEQKDKETEVEQKETEEEDESIESITISFIDDDNKTSKQQLKKINIITNKGLTQKVSNIIYTLPTDYELIQLNTNDMTGDRTASGILDTFNII